MAASDRWAKVDEIFDNYVDSNADRYVIAQDKSNENSEKRKVFQIDTSLYVHPNKDTDEFMLLQPGDYLDITNPNKPKGIRESDFYENYKVVEIPEEARKMKSLVGLIILFANSYNGMNYEDIPNREYLDVDLNGYIREQAKFHSQYFDKDNHDKDKLHFIHTYTTENELNSLRETFNQQGVSNELFDVLVKDTKHSHYAIEDQLKVHQKSIKNYDFRYIEYGTKIIDNYQFSDKSSMNLVQFGPWVKKGVDVFPNKDYGSTYFITAVDNNISLQFNCPYSQTKDEIKAFKETFEELLKNKKFNDLMEEGRCSMIDLEFFDGSKFIEKVETVEKGLGELVSEKFKEKGLDLGEVFISDILKEERERLAEEQRRLDEIKKGLPDELVKVLENRMKGTKYSFDKQLKVHLDYVNGYDNRYIEHGTKVVDNYNDSNKISVNLVKYGPRVKNAIELLPNKDEGNTYLLTLKDSFVKNWFEDTSLQVNIPYKQSKEEIDKCKQVFNSLLKNKHFVKMLEIGKDALFNASMFKKFGEYHDEYLDKLKNIEAQIDIVIAGKLQEKRIDLSASRGMNEFKVDKKKDSKKITHTISNDNYKNKKSKDLNDKQQSNVKFWDKSNTDKKWVHSFELPKFTFDSLKNKPNLKPKSSKNDKENSNKLDGFSDGK